MNIMIRHTRIDATLLNPFFADNYSYMYTYSLSLVTSTYNTKTANCFVSNIRYRLGDTGNCSNFPYLIFSILKLNSDCIIRKKN